MNLETQIFYILEIIGTVAFAVSGAMVAVERRLDVFGVVFLGMITAVGGGIIRDLLLGRFPPAAFTNMEYVLTACAVSLAVFLVAYFADKTYFSKAKLAEDVNNIFDAIGLGAFSVSGTQIGIAAGYGDNTFLCIFLGMLTGIGGGLLRDMMSRSVPFVLRKRIYAIAAIMGAAVYYILNRNGVSSALSIFSGVGLTCAIRILATVFKWNLPIAEPAQEISNGR